IGDEGAAKRQGGYNPARGALVIERARAFLDEMAPLARGRHADATAYAVRDGALVVSTSSGTTGLARPEQLRGYRGSANAPTEVLLVNHTLHVELVINRSHPVGKDDKAGVADVIVEAAISTIMDMEDSVAAVDAEDKTAIYRNWLGLVDGTLSATFEKG